MASPQAIQVFEAIYRRTDKQVRDIIAAQIPEAEVDTINLLVGDGINPLVSAVVAAMRVDFRARLSGCFIQEYDGLTGSVQILVQKAPGGVAPVWQTMTPLTAPFPGIVGGRYFADQTLERWQRTMLERQDYLRFTIQSASVFTRLVISLRVRRLEP